MHAQLATAYKVVLDLLVLKIDLEVFRVSERRAFYLRETSDV